MPRIINPASREDWLKIRHSYVSSTESSALFSMNPYMTAFELATIKQEKEAPPEFEGNERMKWGTRLQDAIAEGIQADFGIWIKPLREYVVKDDIAMGSSFDYEIIGGQIGADHVFDDLIPLGPGILEIKNVDSLVYKNQWVDGEAPDHIEIQVQHQMEVLEREWAVIAALIGGNRTEILIRKRDRAVGAAIASKVREFWTNLAAGILPPVTMPEDAAFLIKLHQYAEVDKVYDGQHDDELRRLCGVYSKYAAVEKRASERKKAAQAFILRHIGTAERALAQGFSVSAGMVAGCHVEYDRAPYRNFRVTQKKVKSSGKDIDTSQH